VSSAPESGQRRRLAVVGESFRPICAPEILHSFELHETELSSSTSEESLRNVGFPEAVYILQLQFSHPQLAKSAIKARDMSPNRHFPSRDSKLLSEPENTESFINDSLNPDSNVISSRLL
jgi:hypothetical protein